jgi:glycosyltransferase involved in cell wall biosynthesis
MSTYRLLGLTTSFPLQADGSAGVFVRRLYQNLPAHWEVDVVCPDDSGAHSSASGEHNENGPLRIHAVRYAPRILQVLAQGSGGVVAGLRRAPWRAALVPVLLLSLAWRCARVARHADLIHANWAICGAIASVVGKIIKRPVVTTLRGDDVTRAGRSWLERRLLDAAVKGSHSIVCVSEAMATQLRASYPNRARDIHVCLNGVDEAFLHVARSTPISGCLRIVAVGSLIERKGYDLLIDAVARMRHRDGVRVRIAGDGPQRSRLQRQATTLGITDRVDFTGEVAPEEIPQFLADADVFILTSRSEGRPNVVIEALAAGLPVVSSALPGIDGLVKHGENGWMVEIGDIAGFAHALDEAFADPDERVRRAALAQESMRGEDCSWAMTGHRYDRLFMNVLVERREAAL